jgi:ribose transport system permease protein
MRRYAVAALRTYGVVFALAILVIVVSIESPVFLTERNIFNLTSQWAPAGIIAVGMTYVILTGGFDLSVGAAYAFCAVAAATFAQDVSTGVAYLAALGIGTGIGLVNGILVSAVKVNPFIATLGTALALGGGALVWTKNAPISVDRVGFDSLGNGRWYDFPYAGMVMLGFLVVGGLVLAKTIYGQWIYAAGGNLEAAKLSGIRTGEVVASTYVFTGFCCGVAGIIGASQLSSAQADMDPDLLFDVITIVVLGGTSLAGGYGAMWRTVVGLAIIATLTNGFNLLDLDPNYQDIFKGVILVGALSLDSYARRVARRGIGASGFGRWRGRTAPATEGSEQ